MQNQERRREQFVQPPPSLSSDGKNNTKVIIVVGQPVEFFSNDLSVNRKVKLASSIGSNLAPSHQRLFLELPRDEDKVAVADFIMDSILTQFNLRYI